MFVSARGAPLSAPGFSRMIERAAIAADLGIKAHAHMLRHACGYKLANDGHDTRAIQAYLGHRNMLLFAAQGLPSVTCGQKEPHGKDPSWWGPRWGLVRTHYGTGAGERGLESARHLGSISI
jgi:Phage integrase family